MFDNLLSDLCKRKINEALKNKRVRVSKRTITEELGPDDRDDKAIEQYRQQILDYLKKNPLEFYFDYNDEMSESQVEEIIAGNIDKAYEEFADSTIDWQSDMEFELFKGLLEEIPELEAAGWGAMDLRDEFMDNIEWEGNGLLDLANKTTVRVRVTLYTNYDGVGDMDMEGAQDYINQLARLFRGKITKADLNKELAETTSGSNQFVFAGRTPLSAFMGDINASNFKTITISGGMAGFFDSWNGAGGTLDVPVKGAVTIPKQWGPAKGYDVVGIVPDWKKYGIEETYGMGTWPDIKITFA